MSRLRDGFCETDLRSCCNSLTFRMILAVGDHLHADITIVTLLIGRSDKLLPLHITELANDR